MATKKATEILTLSTVQNDLGERMQRAFKHLRDELELPSDVATAEYIGLSTSYNHYLTLRRPWSSEAICRVAVGLNCTVAEMLVVAS